MSVLIDFLFITGNPQLICCPGEADANQSGGVNASITDLTLGDVAVLIDNLFINGTPLKECL